MRLILPLLALLLFGCWTGDKLYSAADAVAAIPAGKYYDELATRAPTGRVTIEPNGMTRVVPDNPEDKTSILGFVPLDTDRVKFAVWMAGEDDGRTVDDEGIYGLLIREGDKYLLFMPDCSENADIAVAAGAQIEKGMVDACRFPNRMSLETALRNWRPKPDQAMARFKRIGD